MKVVRVIAFYDKATNYLSDRYILEFDFDFLSQFFTPASDDPLMYDCYEIDKNIAKRMQKHIDFNFNFDLFDYYLEAYQDEL